MDLNKISTTKKLTLASIAIAINIVGGFIALGLRLPIYLDGLGTVLVAFVLGPKWGALTGFVSACVNGASFDIYSFYFSPAQILLGFLAGEIKELKIPNIKKQILLNFIKFFISNTNLYCKFNNCSKTFWYSYFIWLFIFCSNIKSYGS